MWRALKLNRCGIKSFQLNRQHFVARTSQHSYRMGTAAGRKKKVGGNAVGIFPRLSYHSIEL